MAKSCKYVKRDVDIKSSNAQKMHILVMSAIEIVKVKLSLCLSNRAPLHEDVWGVDV
jgi:hypothetical protein